MIKIDSPMSVRIDKFGKYAYVHDSDDNYHVVSLAKRPYRELRVVNDFHGPAYVFDRRTYDKSREKNKYTQVKLETLFYTQSKQAYRSTVQDMIHDRLLRIDDSEND